MNIIADKKTLLNALARIQGIVEKSSIKPITSNALLEAREKELSVSATNLQIGMTSKYDAVQVVKEGKISVNARKFYEIVKELPEKEINVQEKENYRIEIRCGDEVSFNINGLPPEDFPVFTKENEDYRDTWETEKVLMMLGMTSFSISRDETKLNICGSFMENIEGNQIRIVTTDGYRLSIVEDILGKKLPLENGMTIPHKAVTELNRILLEKREDKKIDVRIFKNSILVTAGEIELFIRLMEKKFPDYKVILPGDGYENVEVKVEERKIKPALKRTAIIAQENNRPVVFSFRENKLEMFTEDSEFGNVHENLVLEQEVSENFKFCINATYLLDVLNAIDDDIIIQFNKEEENKPIIVRPFSRKEKAKYIIMPMIMD